MPDELYCEKRLAKQDSVVAREIMGEVILVPIRRSAGEVDSIYCLNEVAARVWNLIDGERSIRQIVGLIADEYDVRHEVAMQDTVDLCKELLDLGAAREI